MRGETGRDDRGTPDLPEESPTPIAGAASNFDPPSAQGSPANSADYRAGVSENITDRSWRGLPARGTANSFLESRCSAV